jgi:hypothetical protein
MDAGTELAFGPVRMTIGSWNGCEELKHEPSCWDESNGDISKTIRKR